MSTQKDAASALDVSTGSLPVLSVLYLIERWGKNAGQWKSDVEYHKRLIFKDDPAAAISVASCEARASIYAVCIQDLRTEMARANQRQPEENNQICRGSAADTNHHE
jgi:hypothetical protein